MFAEREGTPRVKNSKGKSRFTVSADGKGVVSHAGTALLRELARDSGLVAGWTDVLLDTYQGPPVRAPGQVLADLAVSIADGGTALADLRTLRDQDKLFGTVASDATAWRVLDRVSPGKLAEIRTARVGARAAVWAAGGGPDVAAGLRLFFDASLLDAHSEKEDPRPTWKKGFGFHPLLCYLDRPEVAGVEALAGLLRPGNAGSNTATDHIAVLNLALAGLPEHARPRPGDTTGPAVLVSADSAGATHAFAKRLRELGCQFSLGFPIEVRVQDAINTVPEKAWTAAYNRDGQPRRGARVAELTDLLDLSAWPEGSRVIVRRERPHPGAQIRFTDAAGHRFTAFITDTPAGGPSRQLADLEVRHRAHARVEDAIRVGKDTGMANLPCHSATANAPWLELALTGADLLTWTKALCLEETSLARAEPATLPLPTPAPRGPGRGQSPSRLPQDRPGLALGRRPGDRLRPTACRLHLTPSHPPRQPRTGNPATGATAGTPARPAGETQPKRPPNHCPTDTPEPRERSRLVVCH